MNRRYFLRRSLLGATGTAAAATPAAAAAAANATRDGATGNQTIRPLANDYSVLWKAADPAREIGYCPALARLRDGRLIGCLLHAGPKTGDDRPWTVNVHTSDDGGNHWRHRVDVDMIDCFPFEAGSAVYVIGGRHDLTIIRSDDRGDTWSDPVRITRNKLWYSHPGSAVYANGRIYFVMEQITEPIDRGFPTHVFAPVVLSARTTDDLTRPEAWTFSNVLGFQDVLESYGAPNLIGVPFYEPGRYPHPANSRSMAPIGWGESNLLQIRDPAHIWFDPDGHTFHLLARSVTGQTNLACLARAVESPDGSNITVSLQTAPSGEPVLYVPLPGGQVSFHIVYDIPTRLFWMISSQATDSTRRAELLEPKRYGMPNQERHRLALHFSKNAVDWCFAGLVAAANHVGQSHHGGNMVVDGDDLLILMRTADASALNAHNSNLITLHRISDFRALVY